MSAPPEELIIERLGHLGDGIAPGPVYVARALPGEHVAGDVIEGRIAAPRILTPSAHRVRPPCPHYRSCGGCALQHADDGFVTEWKEQIVRAALAAHGLSAPFRPPAISPPQSRRRASLTGRRMKSGALVGFHGARSDSITAVPDCQILRPELRDLLPGLETITRFAASRKSSLTLALTLTETGVDLDITGGKTPDRTTEAALIAAGAGLGLARLSWAGETLAQWHEPLVQLGPARVPIPSGAFLQATLEGEAALVAAVREAVGPARRIVDLFAGCGTFALPLAREAEAHAVEGDRALLQALETGWRRGEGLKRVTTETRDLYRRPLAGDELRKYDAAVIDPPRAGAEAQMAELAQSGIARIAAVSCNPVSFARDAAELVNSGYQIDWLQVVDQFRWSPHVELVAGFSRPGAS